MIAVVDFELQPLLMNIVSTRCEEQLLAADISELRPHAESLVKHKAGECIGCIERRHGRSLPKQI